MMMHGGITAQPEDPSAVRLPPAQAAEALAARPPMALNGGVADPLRPSRAVVGDSLVTVGSLPSNFIAYNASITRFEDLRLMVFRADTQVSVQGPLANDHAANGHAAVPSVPPMPLLSAGETKPEVNTGPRSLKSVQCLGMVALDPQWAPQGCHSILETRSHEQQHPSAEDPRLQVFSGELYVIYNINFAGNRRMQVGRVHVDRRSSKGLHFALVGHQHLDPPNNPERFALRWQKNWSPFVHNADLHFLYESNPPWVLKVDRAKLGAADPCLVAIEVGRGHRQVPWAYGEMRGGTPALRVKEFDGLLTIFHSRCQIPTVIGLQWHYVMGAAVLHDEPPFEIKQCSHRPLVAPQFYCEPQAPQQVIFPVGVVDDGALLRVSYGKNDAAIGLLTLEKATLFSEAA
jgi:predicted GH43/DUF377 family glycosyl hydrolase